MIIYNIITHFHTEKDDRGCCKWSNSKRNKTKNRRSSPWYIPSRSKLRTVSRQKQRRILNRQFRCNSYALLEKENRGEIITVPYYRGIWCDVYY